MTGSTYFIAAGVFLGVLVLGLLVRRWIVSRSGEHMTPRMERNLTQFAVVIAVLAGGAVLLAGATPSVKDDILVGVLGSLPRLLLTVAIVIVAVYLGRIIGAITESALRGWSVVMASRTGRIVQVAIVAIGVIIALEQLGVSTELIVLVITATIAALALAAALSLGLGSVPVAKQVAAGRHVTERFEIGAVVEGATFKGEITDIGLTSTRIRTDTGGTIDVPNAVFLEGPVMVHHGNNHQTPE